MNETERYLLSILDDRGEDKMSLIGSCQHCKGELNFLLDRVGVDKVEIEGNGGVRYYPEAEKLVGVCSECISHGKRTGCPTEVYSRVVGYLSPVKRWNSGKKAEMKMRQTFSTDFMPDIPTA